MFSDSQSFVKYVTHISKRSMIYFAMSSFTEKSDSYEIYIKESKSGQNCRTLQVFTCKSILAIIKNIDKPVHFNVETSVKDCPK